MISKFLYQVDLRGRKVITAIVEDNNETIYTPEKTFAMKDREFYTENENETVTKNNGDLVYVCFDDESGRSYLDINLFKDEVKISLTSNIAYASCFGKDFMGVILDYVNYFDYEDCEFIYSGVSKNKRGEKDIYDNFFRKANDDSYVKINIDEKVYFVTKDSDYEYVLTEDFTKAVKVGKNEIRKILIINGFVDEDTEKSDLSFSKFKCIATENGYIYGGHILYKLTYNDRVLKIDTENVVIGLEDRLINSEDAFLKLKDVSYLLGKEKTGKTNIVEANAKFVKQLGDNHYEMYDNPYEATLIDEMDAEILKAAFKVFSDDSSVRRHSKNVYLYYIGNVYSFYDEAQQDYEMGRIITEKEREDYLRIFDLSFNTRTKSEGVIIIKEEKYLNIEIKEDMSFAVNLNDSSYNASIFTEEEANAIINIFKWNVSKRELQNFIINNNLRPYNIVVGNERTNLIDNYNVMMKEITENKHRMCGYEKLSDIKVESQKGSLEYLRRFYPKNVLDYRQMFENIFKYKEAKNILIIGSRFNLELEALSSTVSSRVNVTILNESKFGYFPKIILNPLINLAGMYKLKLQNLPKSFLSQFDLIVFGQTFNENVEDFKDTLDEFISEDNEVIFATLKTCKLDRVIDPMQLYFKDKLDLRRKHFNHDLDKLVPFIKISNDTTTHMRNSVCRCNRPNCIIDDPYIDNEYSYHSILVKKNHKLIDFYRKR